MRGFSVDSLSEGSSPRPEVLKLIALSIKVHERVVLWLELRLEEAPGPFPPIIIVPEIDLPPIGGYCFP